MFRIEAQDEKFQKKANRELAFHCGDEYYEGLEIQAENLVLEMLIDNSLFYYAVELFWNDIPMGVIAAEN